MNERSEEYVAFYLNKMRIEIRHVFKIKLENMKKILVDIK